MHQQYTIEVSKIQKRIKETCIYVPEHGPMLGKLPGTRYKSQFYMYNALFDPAFMNSVSYCFFEIISSQTDLLQNGFQIAGTESAIPILTHFPAYYYNRTNREILNSFLIRKESKRYGRHNIIEGKADPYLPTLVVDPLCNSTGAFWHCDNVLKNLKLERLDYCLAILNKYDVKDPEHKNPFHDRYSGQHCYAITTRDEL